MVPDVKSHGGHGRPMLDGATVRLDRALLEPYCSSLRGALDGDCAAVPAMAIFRTALGGDEPGLDELGRAARARPDALRAVAGLLTLPFLQACSRAWSEAARVADPVGWCPVCGGWPAFAEVCGVDRARCARCVRCGAAWPAQPLRCAYCGESDHAALGTLQAESATAPAGIDVCHRCRGYVKVLNTLRPGAPAQVPLDDLASVELDLAALDRGYARPPGIGHRLRVTLE